MTLDLRTWKFDTDDYLTSRFWEILITTRKRSLRGLCFYMCLSFCPQGGCLSQCRLGCTPHPWPEAGTPLGPEAGTPPPETRGTPSWDQRQVSPPRTRGRHPRRARGRHPPPPQTRGRPIPPGSSACWQIWATIGGTHPSGMHSCLYLIFLWHCS